MKCKGLDRINIVDCFQAGGNIVPREADQMIRLPFLRTWFRTRSAIVLHLSNGTMQVGTVGKHSSFDL